MNKFFIFINDLPYALDLNSKLFADDTTLYETFDLKTRTFDTVEYAPISK